MCSLLSHYVRVCLLPNFRVRVRNYIRRDPTVRPNCYWQEVDLPFQSTQQACFLAFELGEVRGLMLSDRANEGDQFKTLPSLQEQ